MQIVEKSGEGLSRVYGVTVPVADLNERLEARIVEITPQLNIKGFRPGKVPAAHVRRVHGKALMAEVVEQTISETTQKVLEENKLRPASEPFSASGGLALVQGNLGRAVIKVSAVPEDRHVIEAPARVFDSQEALHAAFQAGELDRDVVVVVRFQGPRANGMPELHKLTPPLAVLQGKGFRVALVTDGRMSGASGKVPAAIHVSPEALADGPLARVHDGDLIRLDARAGVLEALVSADEWARRPLARRGDAAAEAHAHGLGRELFAGMRRHVTSAEQGACTWL